MEVGGATGIGVIFPGSDTLCVQLYTNTGWNVIRLMITAIGGLQAIWWQVNYLGLVSSLQT